MNTLIKSLYLKRKNKIKLKYPEDWRLFEIEGLFEGANAKICCEDPECSICGYVCQVLRIEEDGENITLLLTNADKNDIIEVEVEYIN